MSKYHTVNDNAYLSTETTNLSLALSLAEARAFLVIFSKY